MTKNIQKRVEDIGNSEAVCNHFMVWNIQGGYSYYRCDKCNFIDGEKTFQEALSQREKEVREEIVGIIKSKLPDEMSQEEMEKYHCEGSVLYWGKKLLQNLTTKE